MHSNIWKKARTQLVMTLVAMLSAFVVWKILPTPKYPLDIDKSLQSVVRDHPEATLLQAGMVRIAEGTLVTHAEGSPQRGPTRNSLQIDSFWMDQTPVTNAQFGTFIDQTGYATTAEQVGFSLVFLPAKKSWATVQGADWRHPFGPDSSIVGRDDQPVVHVSAYDALMYAEWSGKRLPTAAEYEYAARGGLIDRRFPWGNSIHARGEQFANLWQGRFPDFDLGRDGYQSLSPVQAYAPNRLNLFDMVGNVKCWSADLWSPQADGLENSRGGADTDLERIVCGSSWLSAENLDPPSVWARRSYPAERTSNDVGFRCVRDGDSTLAPDPNKDGDKLF